MRRVWMGMLFALVVAVRAGGQTRSFTLTVLVTDSRNGNPVPQAEVEVPARSLTSRSDSLGNASFKGLSSGPIRVTATRLGYSPVQAEVVLGYSDTSTVHFFMQLAAVRLDTVRVNAKGLPSYLEEFENRRMRGLGRYLTSAQLDRFGPEAVADFMVMRFTGLRAVWSPNHMSVALASSRGPVSFRGGSVCFAQLYIDGFKAGGEELADLKQGDVAGIEYYSNVAPVQYARGARCGVVIIWTKRY